MSTQACNRRDLLKTFGAGAVLLTVPGCAGLTKIQTKSPNRKPNIILIMADDLGYGDLGCYGNKNINTPNIDALAKAGLKFTDFHSNGPVCTPTRAALLTGRYQQRCGLEAVIYARGETRQTGLAPQQLTFAEVLKPAGYTTAIFGKWHLGYRVQFNPAKQGFDEFYGYVSGNVDYHSHIDGAGYDDWWHNTQKIRETGYVTDLITDHAVDFIEKNKDRPFCLYIPHEAPHFPYQGRNDRPDRTAGNPRPLLGSRNDRAAAYKEMVEAMDDGIGRVLNTIKRLGLQNKTFVFFCSDNGATRPGSNGPLRGKKGGLWEGGHRVPAICCWPGHIKPATVTHETAMTMDLFPTMAALTGAKIPPELKLDGLDLSPVLLRRKKLPSRTLFWQYNAQMAVRKGRWKLLTVKEHQGLYNLEKDITEQNNSLRTEAKRAEQMKSELRQWQKDVLAGVTRRA